MYLVPRYVYVGTYVPGLVHIPPQKRTEGLLMQLLQKNKTKNNLNTELTEMGVFSAVAGNHLPNQLQKEYYRLSSTCGAPRNHTNVQPVDAHV